MPLPDPTPVSSAAPPRLAAWQVALAGLLSLATAMGIGRFAFTPLLPMMLHDQVVDLPGASWLASANYLGYLLGALACTLQRWVWGRFPRWPAVWGSQAVRWGLVATCGLTLGMALPLPLLWPLLRFAAGVASAIVFVFVSGWCMARLSERGVPQLGGIMFTGPGLGIMVSGLAASGMVALDWRAASGWLVFGLMAVGLTALVWPAMHRAHDLPLVSAAAAAPPPAGTPQAASVAWPMGLLTLAYGLAGFGYIVTATFLPVIARSAMPGSPWLDLFWPIFGLGVVIGALLSTRLKPGLDLRLLLVVSYLMQALGIAAGLWWPNLAGFALGSLLLGLPFTVITFLAMQEVRRLCPDAAAATTYMALLTAMYGIGQIVGPPLVAWLIHHSANPGEGFWRSLTLAASALGLGAVVYLVMWRVWPMPRSR